MDRREETQHERNLYQKELDEQKGQEIDFSKQYVDENGKKFRVPYRMVKRVVFSKISKAELKDIPHAARLQYRLMLKDSILKAAVNFTKSTITVTYNPEGSDNLKEKISQKGIIEFIASEGVHVDSNAIKEEDFDYYKNFYSYAFSPPSIREHPPYSYTMEQWKEMKPEWETRQKEVAQEKKERFKIWQKEYYEQYILGKKPKEDKKDKGFWFHGV